MRVITASRKVVDLGPRKAHYNVLGTLAAQPYFKPLPEGVTWRNTPRSWLMGAKAHARAESKLDYNRKHRAENLEHYRELERERKRRWRARQKEALVV